MKNEVETKPVEETHKAGEIEPLADIVGFRVWKNDKEAIIFSKDQENMAILSSEIFKISEKANEPE